MSNFNQSNQKVDRQFNAAGHIIDNRVRVANHKIVHNHIPAPLETIKEAWSITSNWFRNLLPERRDHSSIVQFDTNHHREIERIASERLELAKIDSSRRADAQNRLIQLKEEERTLQKAKFEWEKSVVQENLRLIRNSHDLAIEASRRNHQSITDMHYLPLQGSRDDIIDSLSQDAGKFFIISSPPKVFRDDVQAFKSLEAEIPHELCDAIKKYYGDEMTESVIGYRNIFNGPIDEINASTVGKFIAPTPTLIFHSQVTYQKVIIWITLTLPVVELVASQAQSSEQQFDIKILQDKFSLPAWNWMNLKKELEAEGQDSDATILEIVSTIHLIVALYFCDLYCLKLNPNHIPKLFEFLAEPSFPDHLQAWSEPLKSSLIEAQKKIKEELDRIVALEVNLRQSRTENYSDYSDFSNFPVIGSVIGIIFLFTMCSHQSPNITGGNVGTQSFIAQQQVRTGIIQADRDGKGSARLRVVPDGKIISELLNGTSVVMGEVSSNGKWQRVTTENGKSGWVWADYIQQ